MPDEKPLTNAELRDAVRLLLDREEERAERKRRRAGRRARRKQQETEAGIARLARSIETIKWCVLTISAVMTIGLVIGITVVIEVEREAERIKEKVESIEREAEMIREKIRHPLETLGGTLGRQLDSRILDFVDGDGSDE